MAKYEIILKKDVWVCRDKEPNEKSKRRKTYYKDKDKKIVISHMRKLNLAYARSCKKKKVNEIIEKMAKLKIDITK